MTVFYLMNLATYMRHGLFIIIIILFTPANEDYSLQ